MEQMMMSDAEPVRFYAYPHVGVDVTGGPFIDKLYTVHFFVDEKQPSAHGEVHPFWEIAYVDEGAVEAVLGEKCAELHAGELLLVAPDVPHAFRAWRGENYSMFILSFSCAWPGLAPLAERAVFPATPVLRQLIGAIVRKARRDFLFRLDRIHPNQIKLKKTAPDTALEVIRRLAELLIMLLGENEKEDFLPESGSNLRAQPQVMKAVEFLHMNADRRLSLSEVCARVGLSAPQLQKLFKRDIGVSVMQYHAGLRVSRAKYLIRRGGHTMTEIAEMTGFSSVHHFSSCFKKSEGLTPGGYARAVRRWMDGV